MKKVLPVIIVILLIIVVGAGVVMSTLGMKYLPTDDRIDYASTFDLKAYECTIALNKEIIDNRAVIADERVYLDMDLVTERLNTRFYWDNTELKLLYTTATETMIIEPDASAYTVASWSDSTDADEGYVIVKKLDGAYYVAAEFVKKYTQMDYAEYTDPNRVVIQTTWGDIQVVTAEKETSLRYRGGVKAEILDTIEAGEQMVVLEEYDDWTQVFSANGYLGWVDTASIGKVTDAAETAPAFEEPVYTNLVRDHKIIMGWHQVVYSGGNEGISSLLAQCPGMNTISPTWFYFTDTEGNVGEIASSDYVSTCHANGLEVWALFSNEFAASEGARSFDSDKTRLVLDSTSKRNSTISQLISYVLQYNIDGINLDFELITQEDADDYIQFVRELSLACRANNIVLSIDNYVPEYTYYYNRREQGIVADYVVIMGYDENTAASTIPGPVASYDYVKKGIEDTLAIVDAEKVINGMPFYTRVWSTSESGNVSSFACGMSEAAGYLANHGVEAEYSESYGLNYGTYTSDVDGQKYEIWLQDQTAIASETQLALDYNIAGVAAWKIGFESGSEIWNTISSYYQ